MFHMIQGLTFKFTQFTFSGLDGLVQIWFLAKHERNMK